MLTKVSCRGSRLNQLDYCLDDLWWCSVAQSCPTLSNPVDCSTAGLPVLHCLLQLDQTHVHWVSDAIQPSHPPLPPSPPALTLSQHQGLLQWIGSLHQVAKVLELQLQHQSFQWIFRVLYDWLVWSCSPRDLSLLQDNSSKGPPSSLPPSAFLMVQLSLLR